MMTNFDWQLHKKVRVLLASNDATLTERVWAFLEQGGDTMPIGTAIGSRECIEMLKNHAPDVLLITDDLPGEDVLDVCRQAIHIHPRIASVILACQSHYQDHQYLHQALDSGVCDVIHVEPPYTTLRYQTIIDSVLQAYNIIQDRVSGVGGGIGRVISFFSFKGGVGKTTLAANLAFLLSSQEDRSRAILSDFNWQFGSLETYVGHTASQSVLDLIPVLDGISRTDLENIAPLINDRLRLLSAPLDAERVEFMRDVLERDVLEDDRASFIDDALAQIREQQTVHINAGQTEYLELLLKKEKVKQIVLTLARRTIHSLRRNYHYVVLDTPSHLDDVTLTALELSDLVVLVCTPDLPSVRATRAAMNVLEEMGLRREQIAYCVNRATRRADIRSDDIRNLFSGYDMLGEVSADFRTLQPFINNGSLIAELAPNAAMTRELRQFAAHVTERLPVARAA